MSKKAGFTFIEQGVLILMIALLAAVVAPRLTAFQQGQNYRKFVEESKALFGFARERAIETRSEYRLSVNEGQRRLELSRANQEGEQTTDAQAERTVALAEGVQITRTAMDGNDASSESWEISFYPDGSATRGGIEMDSDGRTISLQVDAISGKTKFVEGELPDDEVEKWEAGEREQRIGGG